MEEFKIPSFIKSDWRVLADFRTTLSRFGIIEVWHVDNLSDLIMWTKRLKDEDEN
jgi:hypothetical protein